VTRATVPHTTRILIRFGWTCDFSCGVIPHLQCPHYLLCDVGWPRVPSPFLISPLVPHGQTHHTQFPFNLQTPHYTFAFPGVNFHTFPTRTFPTRSTQDVVPHDYDYVIHLQLLLFHTTTCHTVCLFPTHILHTGLQLFTHTWIIHTHVGPRLWIYIVPAHRGCTCHSVILRYTAHHATFTWAVRTTHTHGCYYHGSRTTPPHHCTQFTRTTTRFSDRLVQFIPHTLLFYYTHHHRTFSVVYTRHTPHYWTTLGYFHAANYHVHAFPTHWLRFTHSCVLVDTFYSAWFFVWFPHIGCGGIHTHHTHTLLPFTHGWDGSSVWFPCYTGYSGPTHTHTHVWSLMDFLFVGLLVGSTLFTPLPTHHS